MIVDRPLYSCPCCGQPGREFQVFGEPDEPARIYWRCEKHVGRNPCLVPGCGRTFAHEGPEGYDNEVICGKHWRTIPKHWRTRLSLIRRQGARRGWPDAAVEAYHSMWRRCRDFAAGGETVNAVEVHKFLDQL